MSREHQALRGLIAVLLVATAALFAVATTIERSTKDEHAATESTEPISTTEQATATEQPQASHPKDESVPHEEGELGHAEGPDDHAEETEVHTETSEAGQASTEPPGEEAGHDKEGGTHDESEEASERLFGIDLESPGLIALAVLLSLALATVVWFRPSAVLFLLVAAFTLGFAVLDGRELLHQLDEDRTSLAVMAVAITVG
ncbi:MAG: hypothetical protein ACRDKJ_03100, partial [Actinomycetota bacterium]